MGLTQDILAKYVQNTSKMALATGFCSIWRPPSRPLQQFLCFQYIILSLKYIQEHCPGDENKNLKRQAALHSQNVIFLPFLILRILGLICSLAFFSKTDGHRAQSCITSTNKLAYCGHFKLCLGSVRPSEANMDLAQNPEKGVVTSGKCYHF